MEAVDNNCGLFLTVFRAVQYSVIFANVLQICVLGRGAVLNDGEYIENEAAVMTGSDLRTGAICGR